MGTEHDEILVAFSPNQKMPPGYCVKFFEIDEHYHWVHGDNYGPACGGRFLARRMAWANYRINQTAEQTRVAIACWQSSPST